MYGVAEAPDSVEIEHVGRWERPRRFTYPGVELLRTTADKAGLHAVVSVSGYASLGYLEGEGERAPVWRVSWDTGVRFRMRRSGSGPGRSASKRRHRSHASSYRPKHALR